MYNILKEIEDHIFFQDIDDDNYLIQEEQFNQTLNLITTKEINYSSTENIFINKKRENDIIKHSSEKSTKYRYDNLKRECKHLVIENVMKFINDKIYDEYKGNIGIGLTKKKLMKLNQFQKANTDAEFNKNFIRKTLKEILSQNITKQINFYDQDHNKKIIETVISEKKEKFEKLFNLTFIECVEHFIGDKQIEELNGLTLFTELKDQIIKKHGKEGELYYENLKLFLKDFENKINKAKPRKKRANTKVNDNLKYY